MATRSRSSGRRPEPRRDAAPDVAASATGVGLAPGPSLASATLPRVWQGLGYRPLLLAQLLCFSAAATLLSAKVLLVIVDVHRLTVLRYVATGLIVVGAGCAAANLVGMLVSLYRRTRGVANEQ